MSFNGQENFDESLTLTLEPAALDQGEREGQRERERESARKC